LDGEPVAFAIGASGAAPLHYQWLHNDTTIEGATNNALSIVSASASHSGHYVVVITNHLGAVTSAVASLVVSASEVPPTFTLPPSSIYSTPEGLSVSMNATASGTPPLSYQWFFEGAPLPGSTNKSLTLSNVQPGNAGTYLLTVSNAYGKITSDGSTLNVLSNATGGTLHFANFSFNPVLDVSGITGVPAGTGYVAAIYVGLQSNELSVAGAAAPFIVPGRFLGGTRYVPEATAGQTVLAQVRVWDSKISSSYSEAVGLGARHGESAVFQLTLGGSIIPPAVLTPMPSFTLVSGTAVAARRKSLSGNTVRSKIASLSRSNDVNTLVISGPVGSLLAIEASSDLAEWSVIDYLPNNSGVVKLNDPRPAGTPQMFYRARVVNP
jgi:hypothetical protein